MIKIGIIEDDPALRRSIVDFIDIDTDLFLSFSCNSIEKWITHFENEKENPFILFLDIGLPGISGLKAISIIKKAYPATILIVISGDSSFESIWEAITNGANGYLLKPFSLKEFKQQIEIVKAGGAVLSPNIAEKLLRSLNPGISDDNKKNSYLTSRQNEVVEYLVKGLTYKEIANILRISITTVNDHIKKIYLKMGVNSKSELVNKVLTSRPNENI